MMDVPYGTSIKLSGEFKTPAGALFDPTTVLCRVKVPAGTETTFTYGTDIALIKDSTGLYSMWYLPATVGSYTVRFKGSGGQSIASEQNFTVTGSAFTTP